MKFRSTKRAAEYVERRKLVARLLGERPVCESIDALSANVGALPPGMLSEFFELRSKCTRQSSEIHEIKTRARGGSILDPSNCAALCHSCHAWVTEHPKLAGEIGLMKNSWEE